MLRFHCFLLLCFVVWLCFRFKTLSLVYECPPTRDAPPIIGRGLQGRAEKRKRNVFELFFHAILSSHGVQTFRSKIK
uniref:Putative secreted protein n=1 Tax=Anopheles marajoara TaxID=58244 RepID=A0A2M4CCQ3_9DIPT